MQTIKINFSGMSGIFDSRNNFIINILEKHFNVEISDRPDFLIYSVNSKDYLKYDCVRVFFTPENLIPDFNVCDYAIGFHHINFEDRYIRYPLYLVDSFKAYKGDDYGTDLQLALQKHKNAKQYFQNKKSFCSFVYSNSEGAQCRTEIFRALNSYKMVDSGGNYLNNIGKVIEDKLCFQKKHKFVIAFENSSMNGYTTEKIVHAFAAGAVPIYWGNPQISLEFNSGSFINCHEYGLTNKGGKSAIEKIVDFVKELDQDDHKYLQMLETPAFCSETYVEEQKKKLESYLIHVFSQKRENAYRRNRYYWGVRYERKQKLGNAFYWQCRKLIPLRDALRRIIRH